jgi:hypothetical protein
MRNPAILLIAVAFVAPAASCSSAEAPPALELGELSEILGETVAGTDLVSGEGALFLVGDGADERALLAIRCGWTAAAGELNTVLDVSRLDDPERASLGDRLIEPALDGKGPIFLDAAGKTAGALRQGRPGTHLVGLDGKRRIVSTREVRAE